MAYNQELAERVRQLLVNTPNVEEKKMFGGLGFMVGGKLCLAVGDDKYNGSVMMVRVGKEAYEGALSKPGIQPVFMRGSEMKGYIDLEAKAVSTDELLNNWLGMALDFNKKLRQE